MKSCSDFFLHCNIAYLSAIVEMTPFLYVKSFPGYKNISYSSITHFTYHEEKQEMLNLLLFLNQQAAIHRNEPPPPPQKKKKKKLKKKKNKKKKKKTTIKKIKNY